MILEYLSYRKSRREFMENKDTEKKLDETLEDSEKQKKEKQNKQNNRLAERKGQRPVFPFKRKSF